MPIDPFDLYQSFQSYVNTYVGGWYRPNTDFIVAGNDISNDIWEKLTKQAEKSQENIDDLFPFLTSKNCIVEPQNSYYGTFLQPDDYGRFASARIIVVGDTCVPCADLEKKDQPGDGAGSCDVLVLESQDEVTQAYYAKMCERTIDKIENQRWGAVCAHKTKRPTFDNPKMTQVKSVFRVAPREVSVVVLDYYVRPTPATFVYTQAPGNVQTGAGDQIIYNKAGSKPFQWPSTMVNEFLIRLGERYGFFTRDQFMSQSSTQQKMMK
jgi:hypothetical protein